ncbi:amino acid permease [Protomyces lactucae-debilis]|uniref:Amino acid permease n=1 Tax=Protomyces lactucae-debilis TaxID=2754530 RepID=A0A1Y2F1I4_PROLT|nr:amino acid permease [Protomyces lactucae-debilis]ORY77354.1 amino acid permease [Protomyces lactucae-debilis]
MSAGKASTHEAYTVDPLQSSASSLNEDEKLLARLGYKSVLHRSFALVDNFSAAFAALYFVGGVRVTFGLGISSGGPAAYWSSYVISCIFTFFTAACLAEICSALPAAGSIYFWAAECAGNDYGRLAGFIVAWWSTTAWTTFTASTSQSAANYMLSEIPLFGSSYSTDSNDVKFRAVQWAVAEVLLAIAMLVQYIPPRYYKFVFRAATGVVVLDFLLNLIWLPIGVANTYGFRSAEYVFTHKFNGTGAPAGWDWCLSFLSTAGILVGYDAAGHVAEETKDASKNAARGLFWSAMYSAAGGLVIVILFLFCAPEAETLFSYAIPQPFVAVYSLALGRAHVLLTTIAVVGLIFNTSVSSVAASRLVFAVARDGVLPWSNWIAQVDSRGNPRNAITVIWVVAATLLCTILPSPVSFSSLVSAAGVPTFAAYALILTCRAIITPNEFRNGSWSLGRWSRPMNLIAIPFNWFCVAVLVSPYIFPTTAQNLNYSGIILGAITIFGFISWMVVPKERWLEKKRLLGVRKAQVDREEQSSVHVISETSSK